MNFEKAAALFDGWDDALILSCLQGHMGEMTAYGESPESAVIVSADFRLFAGKPDPALLKGISGPCYLVPKDAAWESLIESHYGSRARKFLRYAIKKEPDVFDREKLASFCRVPGPDYELRMIDEGIYNALLGEPWSADLCIRFENYADYKKRAVGTAVLHRGAPVSGASPYAVYDGGIDIEIDTKPEYRRRGLASACGALLILECLKRNIYPGWDAHDLRSVSLAQKLGYTPDRAYTTYELDGAM